MAGGGGGGANYFPSRPARLQGLIKKTLEETEQKSLEVDVNDFLQQLLAKMNDRNPEKVQQYINDLAKILGENQEIDRFLFGGSVAKHTFVDGLSDIDALVVLDRQTLENKTPREVLKDFFDSLYAGLTHDEIVTVDKGNLAVTVTYTDGTEIQMLPAIRRGREICIADASGTEWKGINPKAFQRELTKANERLNFALVPTIKLAKSTLSGLPEDIRPTGYHVESLSLETTKGYRGPKTVKSLLLHVLTAASRRVLQPIADVTNQSRNVDAYLGKKNSEQRARLSLALAGIARRMNAASTVSRWKEIIES
jgi:hypothetical protein